jgi:hypothetical protein
MEKVWQEAGSPNGKTFLLRLGTAETGRKYYSYLLFRGINDPEVDFSPVLTLDQVLHKVSVTRSSWPSQSYVDYDLGTAVGINAIDRLALKMPEECANSLQLTGANGFSVAGARGPVAFSGRYDTEAGKFIVTLANPILQPMYLRGDFTCMGKQAFSFYLPFVPGDYNGDGRLDEMDAVQWRLFSQLDFDPAGVIALWLDFNVDGKANLDDYAALRDHLPPVPTPTATPEPTISPTPTATPAPSPTPHPGSCPLAGDFDNNGIVDGADYIYMQAHSANLTVDYIIWRKHQGEYANCVPEN